MWIIAVTVLIVKPANHANHAKVAKRNPAKVRVVRNVRVNASIVIVLMVVKRY